MKITTAVLPAAAGLLGAAIVLAGCTSSGGSPGAGASVSGVPSVATSSTGSVLPVTPSSASASASSTAPSTAGGPAPSATASGSARAGATSNPTVVPTGTVAPYSTPGRVPTLANDQSKVLASDPGSASATCGRVTARTNVLRAGALAVGDFASAQQQFRSAKGKSAAEVALYVVPQHAAHMKSISTTVGLASGGATKTVTSTSVEDGDASRYYNVTVPIARAGTYRLSMVSGADKGCFLVAFSR